MGLLSKKKQPEPELELKSSRQSNKEDLPKEEEEVEIVDYEPTEDIVDLEDYKDEIKKESNKEKRVPKKEQGYIEDIEPEDDSNMDNKNTENIKDVEKIKNIKEELEGDGKKLTLDDIKLTYKILVCDLILLETEFKKSGLLMLSRKEGLEIIMKENGLLDKDIEDMQKEILGG